MVLGGTRQLTGLDLSHCTAITGRGLAQVLI